jgi:hypothetical protein
MFATNVTGLSSMSKLDHANGVASVLLDGEHRKGHGQKWAHRRDGIRQPDCTDCRKRRAHKLTPNCR